MPRIRNITDDTRTLLSGRVVPPDGLVDVTADELPGYECQTRIWRVEPTRKSSKEEE